GLNVYLRQHAAETLELPVDSADVLCDLDTPEDYERLRRAGLDATAEGGETPPPLCRRCRGIALPRPRPPPAPLLPLAPAPLRDPLLPSAAALDAAAHDRFAPSGPPCQNHFLDVQLMLGLENIVRLQAEVYHGERWTLLAEAQVGLEFIFVPSVGGGVRAA